MRAAPGARRLRRRDVRMEPQPRMNPVLPLLSTLPWAHLRVWQVAGFPSSARRAAENSPALKCWAGVDGEPGPGRDERNSVLTLLSSLTGLCGSKAANPALKCWAIFNRPIGPTPTQTGRCKKWRGALRPLEKHFTRDRSRSRWQASVMSPNLRGPSGAASSSQPRHQRAPNCAAPCDSL